MPGLTNKYIVIKADTGESISNCFVLCPENDPAAVAAIQAYADATDDEKLRNDLVRWIGNYKNYPLTVEELRELVDTDLEDGRNRIWIWNMEFHHSFPALIDGIIDAGICAVYGAGEVEYTEKNYGKTWLAYLRKPYVGAL